MTNSIKKKASDQQSGKVAITGRMSRSDWELAYLKVRALARSHGLEAELAELEPAEQEALNEEPRKTDGD